MWRFAELLNIAFHEVEIRTESLLHKYLFTGMVTMPWCVCVCVCVCLFCKAKKWAKRTKRGECKGSACLECTLIQRSFPGYTWESLIAKSETAEPFSKEVEAARRMLRGTVKPSWADQEFHTADWVHISMEKSYDFWSVSDFEEKFHMRPQDADVEVVEIQDENGRVECGVIMKDEQNPQKKLKVSWGFGSTLDTTLLKGGSALRAEQPTDLQTWYNADMLRSRPAPLQAKPKPQARPLTQDEMKARVAKAKETMLQEAKAAEQAAAPKQAALPAAAQPVAALEEEEDSYSEPEFDPASCLPSEQARRGKGKGKGNRNQNKRDKPRGRPPSASSAGQDGTRRRVCSKRSFAPSATPAASSSVATATGQEAALGGDPVDSRRPAASERSRSPLNARSVATKATTSAQSQSPTERLRGQVAKYLVDVRLDKLVLGQKLGSETSIARRILSACEARPADLGAEAVELRGHLQLSEVAAELAINKMNKIPSKERVKMLHQLWPHMEAHPPAWCANIFLLYIREFTFNGQDDISKWLECVSPLREGLPNPCIASAVG